MELDLKYRMLPADFREASYYGLFLRKRLGFGMAAVAIIAFVIYAVLCINKVLPMYPVTMFIAGAYLIWIILQLAAVERTVLRYTKQKDTLIGAEYHARFQGKQFTVEIPERNYKLAGETAQFASAFEISHCFLLCLSEDQMFIVPTRDMSAAEAETMRTILARELGDRFFTLFTRRRKG